MDYGLACFGLSHIFFFLGRLAVLSRVWVVTVYFWVGWTSLGMSCNVCSFPGWTGDGTGWNQAALVVQGFCSNVKTKLFCFFKSPFFCFTLNYVLVTWTWRVWCRAGWGNLGSALFQYKLCRVSRVQVGPKGVPFLVTHDGRTVRYPDPLVRVNDSIYLDIATGKMKDFIKFDSGEIPWYSLQQETHCVLGLYVLYLIFIGKKYVCYLLCTSLLCFWGNLILHSNAWPWGI